jgi:hypothetical protein
MKYVGATIAAIDDMIAMLSDRSPCSPRHGGRSALSEGVVPVMCASTRKEGERSRRTPHRTRRNTSITPK